jgi:hypothetical protein
MNDFEYKVRRKAELRNFLNGDLTAILEMEARQSRARVAASVIYEYVKRQRVSAYQVRH